MKTEQVSAFNLENSNTIFLTSAVLPSQTGMDSQFMKTLKKSQDGRNLVVLAEKNILKVLTNIDKYGSYGVAQCSKNRVGKDEYITDFSPVLNNQVACLWNRGLLTLFEFDSSTSRIRKEVDLFLETGTSNLFFTNSLAVCGKGKNILVSVSDLRNLTKEALIWVVLDVGGRLWIEGKKNFTFREKKSGSIVSDLNCEFDLEDNPLLVMKEQSGGKGIKAYSLEEGGGFKLMKNLQKFTDDQSYGLQYADGHLFSADLSGKIYVLPLGEEISSAKKSMNRSKSSIKMNKKPDYGYEKPLIINNIDNGITPNQVERRNLNNSIYNKSRSISPIGRMNDRNNQSGYNPYQRSQQKPTERYQASRTPPPYKSHYDSQKPSLLQQRYRDPRQGRNESLMNKVVTYPSNNNYNRPPVRDQYRENRMSNPRDNRLNVSALDYITGNPKGGKEVFQEGSGLNLMQRDYGKQDSIHGGMNPRESRHDMTRSSNYNLRDYDRRRSPYPDERDYDRRRSPYPDKRREPPSFDRSGSLSMIPQDSMYANPYKGNAKPIPVNNNLSPINESVYPFNSVAQNPYSSKKKLIIF